jgi:transcriptional regulator with XRE-family HTH domain
MGDQSRREALRKFLMEVRARLRPADVGLASIGRRRVPGLRREEVAALAEVSPAWYTLLETARDIRVSPRMLDRLASALRLSEDEKVHLFSLAIDEMPTVQRATTESAGAIGREYRELKIFTQRSRSVSTLQELGVITADLLFDLMRPVEAACFVEADLTSRQFRHMAQRVDPEYRNPPSGNFAFSDIRDANTVLIEGGLRSTTHAEKFPANTFFERARELGSGRFISQGVHAPSFDGAIAYFQHGNEPHTEREREIVGLVAEIVYLALAARR